MKVFSLYYKETFVVAFPNRERVVDYGKEWYGDKCAWDCNILEEYLSKSPLTYSSPLTSLTPQQTIPCTPGVTLLPETPKTNPGTYPDIYCGVKAEPYKDVRAHWDKKGVMGPNWDNRVEGVDY
jgi:hypothetical protein